MADELPALRLLDALVEPRATTQRELARRIGVSLGATNLLIERMVRKAWVKLTTTPGRRAIYALTPRGMAEKARRTRDWVRHTYRYIGETRAFLIDEIRRRAGPRPRVACVGEHEIGELVAEAVRAVGGRLVDDPARADLVVILSKTKWKRRGTVLDLT